jgi:hypothetical protein
MIVSASYRTDIAAFYGRWFVNRLRAGSCAVVNPYSGQGYRVELTPERVDGFVFWTKNVGPFLRNLPEIARRGYPFVVQHTITGYPRQLESRVAQAGRTVEHLRRVAGFYGPAAVVWRYDPIVLTSLTPPDWHRRTFERLAALLEGVTDEVVVSFAQIYQKTRRNMEAAAREQGFDWSLHEATPPEARRALLADLAGMARAHGIQMAVCSQREFVLPGVTREARCVDAERLARVAGRALAGAPRLKGNREECGCYESRDIGAYDTCPHGCVYCYAVRERELALRRYRAHDPAAESLVPVAGSVTAGLPPAGAAPIPAADVRRRVRGRGAASGGPAQPRLFSDGG